MDIDNNNLEMLITLVNGAYVVKACGYYMVKEFGKKLAESIKSEKLRKQYYQELDNIYMNPLRDNLFVPTPLDLIVAPLTVYRIRKREKSNEK